MMSMIINSFLYLYNIFLNFYDYIIETYQKNVTLFKCTHFDSKILHLAVYDTITKTYTECYNYDNVINLLFAKGIVDVSDLDFPENLVLIYTFPFNGKIYRVISNKPVNTQILDETEIDTEHINFIYCILSEPDSEDKDITHYFMDFKESIYINDSIQTCTYVNALSHYYKKDIWMNENCCLKLIMDNDYNEKIFKEKDILNINSEHEQ